MDLNRLHDLSRIGTLIVLTATVLQQASGQNYMLTSSCDGSVQTGDICTLSCDTRDTSQTLIKWQFGGDSRNINSAPCSSSSPFPPDYSITCPSGSSTVFTVTFTNAQYQRDTTSWRCDFVFGGRESNTVDITVEVPLSSVSISRSPTSITCEATSSPRPSITLYRDGSSESTSPPAVDGSAGWTATLVYSLTGTRVNSLYWCEGANSETKVNSTFSYPEISVTSVSLVNISTNNQEVGAAEGQPLTLTCVTSAASVTWYKNNVPVTTGVSERNEVTSGGTFLTTSSLTLALSKSDLGQQVYCTATNIHTTSPVQSNTARLGVWYGPYQVSLTPPGLSYTVRENQDTIPPISCSANCNPSCTYRWEKNGKTFSNSSVLNLGQSSRSQTGSYRCHIFNTYGSVYTSAVSVDVKSAPDHPTDVSVTSDGSSVYVTWLRGDNGGLAQTFTVKYSRDKTVWTAGGTQTEVEDLEFYKTVISDLDLSTQYFVRVRAHNQLGDSPYTEIVSVTTGVKIAVSETQTTIILGTGIGIGVGICVPVIAVLVVVVVVMYRRISTTETAPSTENRDQQETERAYEDVGPTATVDKSTYEVLDDTKRAEDYTELQVYENSKI